MDVGGVLGWVFGFYVRIAFALSPFPLMLMVMVTMNRTILLLILLARSKLVPDFAFTILFLNLCITALYTGAVPSNKLWWGVQAVSAGIMVGGGVWACRWRELRPIAGFGGGRKGGGVRDERGGYEMVGRGEGGEEGDGGGG